MRKSSKAGAMRFETDGVRPLADVQKFVRGLGLGRRVEMRDGKAVAMYIATGRGPVCIVPGDWIVKDGCGGFYVVPGCTSSRQAPGDET